MATICKLQDDCEQRQGSCKEGLLEALSGGETVLAAAAVRVVLALIESRTIDPEILDHCGGSLPPAKSFTTSYNEGRFVKAI